MHARLGRWEIGTDRSGNRAYESIRVGEFEPESDEAADLEEVAGDFILRHVLERDSVFYEG